MVVSSKWVAKKPYSYIQYDIGAIKLGKNERNNEVGEELPGFDIEVGTVEDEKDKTKWKIIGYVEGTKNDAAMHESDGVFTELDKQSDNGYMVKRTNTVEDGMSGSPWLLKNASGKFEKANGNHSASGPDFAVTPFYTKELIDDILKQLQ